VENFHFPTVRRPEIGTELNKGYNSLLFTAIPTEIVIADRKTNVQIHKILSLDNTAILTPRISKRRTAALVHAPQLILKRDLRHGSVPLAVPFRSGNYNNPSVSWSEYRLMS